MSDLNQTQDDPTPHAYGTLNPAGVQAAMASVLPTGQPHTMSGNSPPTPLPDPPAADAGLPEWASWCADIGRLTRAFKVFPCWPGEKRPLREGWQQAASNDRLTVECMWANDPTANIGLAIEPGFLVIDADIYKPEKAAALAAYEAKHGKLPDTLKFRSARGGYHLVYSTSQNLGNGTGTLPDFGDVRGHGGLIVGPGSWFEGLRYRPEHMAAPVPLPASVEDCLVERKRNDLVSRELPKYVSLDDPANVEKFVAWLSTARVSIEGQGGNNCLAATGAMGSSHALSWDVTLDAMLTHWNPRCEPPWDDDLLEKHGGSGYRSASSSFGNIKGLHRDPLLMFEVRDGQRVQLTEADIAADDGERYPILTSREFLNTFVFPDYLVKGIIQTNTFYSLTSPTGHGKTAVALYLAALIASGRNLGNIEVTQGGVLFLAGENPQDVAGRWHTALAEYWLASSSTPVDFLPRSFPLTAEAAEQLKRRIDAGGRRYSLIIGDSAAAYNPVEDENDNMQMGNYARIWRSLTTCESKPAVIALCHPIKHATRESLVPRGGGAFLAEVDGNLTLWAEGDRSSTALHHQGKLRGVDFAPVTFALDQIRLPPGYLPNSIERPPFVSVVASLRTAEAAEAAARETVTDENVILGLLQYQPGISTRAIATAIGGAGASKVHRLLKNLQEHKPPLARPGRGGQSWEITPAGEREFKKSGQRPPGAEQGMPNAASDPPRGRRRGPG